MADFTFTDAVASSAADTTDYLTNLQQMTDSAPFEIVSRAFT